MRLYILAIATLLFAADEARTPRLKKLNVVALDSHGQPATDLRAQDFQVFEDGKAKQIAYFRFTGARGARAAAGPGEVYNRARVARQPTVVLVDMLSDRMMSDAVIGRQVGETLKKLESGDDVYLYFLTNRGELIPVHALPEEGSEQPPGAIAWTQNAGPLIDATVKRFYGLRPADDFDPSVRFNLTSRAIDALGGQMEKIPGRKNLVWVTHGVPLYYPSIMTNQPVDLTGTFQLLAEKLERAQIVVYTVQQSTHGAGEPPVTEGGMTLELFTSLTGGRMYRTDSADVAIPQARTDSTANYQIAFYTDVPGVDKKRHKLKVTCARKDVRMVTEQEFYALGLDESAAEFEKRVIDDAVQSAEDATEIGVTASVKDMDVDLRIDSEDLLLRKDRDRYVGNVSVVFAVYAGNEQAQITRPVPLPINLSAQQYEERGTITFHQKVQSEQKVEKIRVIVVDGDRRAVGSVTVPVRR
jgi:VWFA-related protein